MPIAPFDGADAPQHDAVFEVLDAHALGGPSVEVVRSKAARNAVAPSNIVEDAVTATSFQQSSA